MANSSTGIVIDKSAFISTGLLAGLIGKNFGDDKNVPGDEKCIGEPKLQYGTWNTTTPTQTAGCFETAMVGNVW